MWNTSTGSEGTGSGCSDVRARAVLADLARPVRLLQAHRQRRRGGRRPGDRRGGLRHLQRQRRLERGRRHQRLLADDRRDVRPRPATAAGSTPANDIYTHTANFYDVTSGNDGSCSPAFLCTAESGYDGPTGIGTPNGITGLETGGSSGGDTVTVTNPGSQSGTVGTAVSKQISATDSASGQTLTYSATGLPAGLSISGSGLISGTPTTAGTSSVTVTATDSTGASGSASFTWTITTSGGGGGGCTAAQLLGNPGFETGSISPWSASSGVSNNDTTDEPAHSGSWDAWLDGYGTTHTDTLSQSVTIPSTCTTATFSFYLHIDTAETTTSTAYDTFKVQVLNSSGTVLATLATFSNLNHNTGYTQHSYSLASYVGQTSP